MEYALLWALLLQKLYRIHIVLPETCLSAYPSTRLSAYPRIRIPAYLPYTSLLLHLLLAFLAPATCYLYPLLKSVMPEVRGTTDFYGGAYPPSKTSPSYAFTTLFEVMGVHLPWAPYDQLLAPKMNYVLLGR